MHVNFTSDLYGLRGSGVSHGDVFTSPRVVGFMLDLIGYTSDKDLSKYKVLEPSFGVGDFLIEIQRRLVRSAQRFKFDASKIMSHNVYGCEIDKVKYDKCIESIRSSMPGFEPLKFKNEDFLSSQWETRFDFIIGNPPYIRYENIPGRLRGQYKANFYSFHYRCDLYVLFFEHCLKHLSKGGRHCFICSNRWLKNEYGKKLRVMISTSYNMEYIIDVEKIDAFKESVLAYPAITLISDNSGYKETRIAYISDVSELKLPLVANKKQIRQCDNWDNLFYDNDMTGLSSIEQQGFKIGIGVATGADKLFISAEFKDTIEDELILPIINAKDLSGNNFHWNGLYLLNPYDQNGSLIDLNNYPKAKQYLEKYRPVLETRHIVKNGRVWYSLIDKVKSELTGQPKILLPDISGNNVIFIDKGVFYPAHNIYYITGGPMADLEILASILMSDFVRRQVENVSNKMNGGMPRWQSQNIRKIRIPLISRISPSQKTRLIEAYHNRDFTDINAVVDDIVNSQCEGNRIIGKIKNPQSLFDYDFL